MCGRRTRNDVTSTLMPLEYCIRASVYTPAAIQHPYRIDLLNPFHLQRPFPAFLVPVLRIATYDPDVTAQIALSTDVSDVPTFPLNTKKCSGERKEGLLWQLHVLLTRLCCPTRQQLSFSFSGSFVSRVLSNRGQSHQHHLYSRSGIHRFVSLRLVVLRLV
jgi:hypothetical protein